MTSEIVAVSSGDIAQIDAIIESVRDAETAATAARGMDKLKLMLQVADKWGEYANEFCMKEAELYVRIARMDGCEEDLPKGKKNLIDWIRSKNETELAAILDDCAHGTRINNIRLSEMKSKVRDPRKDISPFTEYIRISNELLDEFKETGITTVSPKSYLKRWHAFEAPNADTIKAYTEKTRDSVLHAGGVGIADGMGTYVTPKCKDRSKLGEAISVRLKSIYVDVKALRQLCEDADMSPSKDGIEMIQAELNGMVANALH